MMKLSALALNARPDTVDFRDLLYVPTLVEVEPRRPLDEYQKVGIPILDQGKEGACTGFGLATVVHYLLRSRAVDPDDVPVSPHMLYALARRYDEWPGENYSGSSARGAVKGWHKHGVCSADAWPTNADGGANAATTDRLRDAMKRPLGAYYRVNHRDLVAMHAAISEVGVLYATATVHAGWGNVKKDGTIPYPGAAAGGHAFAIVAYDAEGFWIQNSWGDSWGFGGFGRVSYADWLENGTDVWVCRLGAPVVLAAKATAKSRSVFMAQNDGLSHADVRPHVITLENDGLLATSGPYANSKDEVRSYLEHDLVDEVKKWTSKRVLLYAHGGLVDEKSAVQHIGEYVKPMLDAQVYPIGFVWRSDFLSTIVDILKDAFSKRKSEGVFDAAKDFMLDRLDDGLEPLCRLLGGKALWDQMKQNAIAATAGSAGGARFALDVLAPLAASEKLELHIACHSAGSVFMAPLVQWITAPAGAPITEGPLKDAGLVGLGRKLASLTLWAPACTVQTFKDYYLPAVKSGAVKRLRLFTLTDRAEQDDDCGGIYHKSLLYLVSHALEENARIPFIRPGGTPLLGLERDVLGDPVLRKLFGDGKKTPAASDAVAWVRCPNQLSEPFASQASHHVDFDDDDATVRSLVATIASVTAGKDASVQFTGTKLALRARARRAFAN